MKRRRLGEGKNSGGIASGKANPANGKSERNDCGKDAKGYCIHTSQQESLT